MTGAGGPAKAQESYSHHIELLMSGFTGFEKTSRKLVVSPPSGPSPDDVRFFVSAVGDSLQKIKGANGRHKRNSVQESVQGPREG
ncbi:hypothetical protein NDU88_000837 [Pleurodeles waltl]|uniref:Uncharacterized protein n=1 Tax=Pleurodeles waltl TaxID=8319 RepID=A0AAV7MLQ1_PLEWA|nr:hypothetical protein NDU88_000837 [Pleurodeles waltl]